MSITDGGDGVIKLGSAGSRVEDTTSVTLEDVGISLNSDRNWLLGDGSHQSSRRSSLNVMDAGDGNVSSNGMARLIITLVWILSLGILSMRLDVSHSTRLPSTIATLIFSSSVAVNDLLLREAQKSAGGDGVGRLDGRSGREGPARTALLLILDGVNLALSSPVNGSWD